MKGFFRQVRDFLVSLELTVVLLGLSIGLIFWATLAQTDLGVWGVHEKFFHSFFVLLKIPGTEIPIPVFPGGYFIGGLLLINLVCAHAYRFRYTARKTGIWLTHLGLILLLVGELLSGLWQEDYDLVLDNGQTKNYAESERDNELAVIDTTDPTTDAVVAVPEAILAAGEPVQSPHLPFRIVPRLYYPNAGLRLRRDAPEAPPSPATQGIGPQIAATPLPATAKEDDRNLPAAFIELVGPEGSLGTWLVSSELPMPQHFDYGGRSYKLVMRFRRRYFPFSVSLLKFSHDIYPGTDIPKNFSSKVRLTAPAMEREILIFMNNPLRYGGLTFYQKSFANNDRTSVLQVVRNPSWRLPYIACAMMAIGLVVQFCLHLTGFARRRRAAPADKGERPGLPTTSLDRQHPWLRRLPLLALVLALIYVGCSLLPPRNPTSFDTTGFGRLPVLANGRIKPLDTLARSSLLQLQARQLIILPDGKSELTPDEWLLDVFFRPEKADLYRTFVIDNVDLLSLIGRTDENLRIHYDNVVMQMLAAADFVPNRTRRFSYQEISAFLPAIEAQARLAEPVEDKLRTPFQRSVLQLYENILLYQRLEHTLQVPGATDFLGELLQFQQAMPAGIAAVRAKEAGAAHSEAEAAGMIESGRRYAALAEDTNVLAIPPDSAAEGATWKTTGQALLESFATGGVDSNVLGYAGLGYAWRQGRSDQFNTILGLYHDELAKHEPAAIKKTAAEVRFNAAEPFYTSLVLYVTAFLIAVFSWLKWPDALGRSAFWLVVVAWALATAGIVARMWLEGRPPVTNLYSSALFIGWGAVALCLVLEMIYRNGIGSVAAGLIGFGTLIIAQHLALSGDTLEMMRAVLDSNFWLATHVVVVTTGYASTFLAGFLALIYIVRGVFTRSLDQATADALARMVYGIVCFATLFSFVGTVLGGIWADQSWGRFWGWDPKENGALMIVVWNAHILHCRWGGFVRARGLMCLAVFGNIVTSWSWFGTNMLGIGLHSYGFTEAAFWGLSIFVVTQLGLIALANLPLAKWRSFQPKLG